MSFEGDIKKFRKKSLARTLDVKRAVAIKLFSAVILDTPVLTGRLRGNWRISLNQADRTVSETDKDKSGSLVTTLIGRTAGTADIDDTIILSNSLPYVARIEYEGHSSVKAPQGMVRKNVARFRALLAEALGEDRVSDFNGLF